MATMDSEPLYTLKEAARISGARSPEALRMHLLRNPELSTPRYRRVDNARLLSESEVRGLRARFVK